jgi:hypothetical protein
MVSLFWDQRCAWPGTLYWAVTLIKHSNTISQLEQKTNFNSQTSQCTLALSFKYISLWLQLYSIVLLVILSHSALNIWVFTQNFNTQTQKNKINLLETWNQLKWAEEKNLSQYLISTTNSELNEIDRAKSKLRTRWQTVQITLESKLLTSI